MKHCPVCGTELADTAASCFHCGKTLTEAEAAPVTPAVEPAPEEKAEVPAQPVQAPVAEPEAIPQQPVVVVPPKKLLLNTFQYMLLMLLFSIPVVGLIFLFIWGTGHPKNPSLKRFSAAVLLWRLILALLVSGAVLYLFICHGPEVQEALRVLVMDFHALLGIALY